MSLEVGDQTPGDDAVFVNDDNYSNTKATETLDANILAGPMDTSQDCLSPLGIHKLKKSFPNLPSLNCSDRPAPGTDLQTGAVTTSSVTAGVEKGKLTNDFQFEFPMDANTSLMDRIRVTSPIIRGYIQSIKNAVMDDQRLAVPPLSKLLAILEEAWMMKTKDYAYIVCDILRDEGALDSLVQLCCKEYEDEVQMASALVLSQALVVPNREYIARNHLLAVVRFAEAVKDNARISEATTKILECLFKDSEATCDSLIRFGALDTMLYFCKMRETRILRNCAGALANLALYSGPDNQRKMIKRKTQLWLFPLAFSDDDSVKYYALLAIAVLSANKHLEKDIVESGTLKLVEPFLRSHDPNLFRNVDSQHIHGQSKEWLMQLFPVLKSSREEAVALAMFHFSMEACIRSERKNIEDLSYMKTPSLVKQVKHIAAGPFKMAAKFACQALRVSNEEVPCRLSQRVFSWTTEDVSCWLLQLGLPTEVVKRFDECQVDGDLLLLISDENLVNDIKMINGFLRKRFLRELHELRQSTDYSSIDPSSLDNFLKDISPEFSRYTYRMLKTRITLPFLPLLTEEHLRDDCGISNGVHRKMILDAARGVPQTLTSRPSVSSLSPPVLNESPKVSRSIEDFYDAFISYRRQHGSLLASLLKVYLTIRGKKVFLDVDGMVPGLFHEHLTSTIMRSKNFILVLAPKTLDRCVGDNRCQDWVHKEIVIAIERQCKIIPVIQPGHVYPPLHKLPKDLQAFDLPARQSIEWNYEFHESCIDKLIAYMDVEIKTEESPLPAAEQGGIFADGGVMSHIGLPKRFLMLGQKFTRRNSKSTGDLGIRSRESRHALKQAVLTEADYCEFRGRRCRRFLLRQFGLCVIVAAIGIILTIIRSLYSSLLTTDLP